MTSIIANRKTWVTCYCKGKSITSVFCIIQEYTQSWHSLTCMHDSRDQPSPETVDSSSNHDDDGEKNVASMHDLRLKKKDSSFARFARAIFIFVYFTVVLMKSTKWNTTNFAVARTTWARDDNFSVFPLYLQASGTRLIRIYRTISAHFVRHMT